MIATAIRVAAAVGLGGMGGLLGGLFGVGGGFLVIPLLGFFYGMDQQTAQGTALIMVVPDVVLVFRATDDFSGIDLRMAATIAGSALIATYPTARLATGFDPHEGRPRQARGWITVIGVIGGAFSGFLGSAGRSLRRRC